MKNNAQQNGHPRDGMHFSLLHGARMLLQGFEYAEELSRDLWDFAVELPPLRRLGLTNNDFRWLIFKGYVEHAREVSPPGVHREFARDEALVLNRRTCFALTPSGVDWARTLCHDSGFDFPSSVSSNSASLPKEPAGVLPGENNCDRTPKWDRDRQELKWGESLVKHFKLPSINQQTVLMAFEEEKWPPRIDDPLPPDENIDPKRRLNDTIKSLNRNQKSRSVRFLGDGSGRGIRWEPVSDSDATAS